jgi:uncharacterized membrane protein YfcA
MLSATLLFVFGGKLTRTPTSSENSNLRAHTPSFQALIAACFFQFLVAIYGGYFGGGVGFVILAMLTAFGMADIHEMNALKIVLSSSTNGLAVVVFMAKHAVYWPQALIMICGAGLGGYFGAHYSLRLPRAWVRGFVIAVGTGMTAYFFIRVH